MEKRASGIEVEREYFKQKRRAQHISGTEIRPMWPKCREEGKKERQSSSLNRGYIIAAC